MVEEVEVTEVVLTMEVVEMVMGTEEGGGGELRHFHTLSCTQLPPLSTRHCKRYRVKSVL